MKLANILLIAIIMLLFNSSNSQTLGESSVYFMYSPLQSSTTYLVDTDGIVFHTWDCIASPASTAYLLTDGSIIRPYRVSSPTMMGGATGGGMQRIDWNGNILWDYTWSDPNHQQHHECIPIDQGNGNYNVLIISWERKSNAEAIQAGRQNINGEMWPLEIIEIEPQGSNGGNVVWEWHAWDHLCQDVDSTKDNFYLDCSSHPELIDVNIGTLPSGGPLGGSGDWIHANGIDYCPELDQIVFSSHKLHEIFVIDHSTTINESASHSGGNSGMGGDILYRWGNPQNYGAGTAADQILHVVHSANFIDTGYPGEGNILMFNNGDRSGSQNDYSSVEEITAPLSGYTYNLPYNQSQHWMYSNGGTFYSNHLSGAFRLKNGNTLATEGTSGRISEIDNNGNIIFQYTHQGGGSNMAKAVPYEKDYEGILGLATGVLTHEKQVYHIYPNPANHFIQLSTDEEGELKIIDFLGKVSHVESFKKSSRINIENLPSGVYYIQLQTTEHSYTKSLIIQ